MFASFQFNALGIVEERRFQTFQEDSESVLVARIAQSRTAGVFSDFAALGSFARTGEIVPWVTPNWVTYQFEQLSALDPSRKYEIYRSQLGLMGTAHSLLDRVLGHPSLDIHRAVNSGLLALVLVVLVAWSRRVFGLVVACTLAASFLWSDWLTASARNTFWQMWSMFLPTAMVALWSQTRHIARLTSGISIAVASAFFVAIVFRLGSGMEFAPCILIAAVVPLICARPAGSLGLRDTIRAAAAVTAVALAAAATVFWLWFLRETAIEQQIPGAINQMLWAAARRTAVLPGVPIPAGYHEYVEFPLNDLLRTYLATTWQGSIKISLVVYATALSWIAVAGLWRFMYWSEKQLSLRLLAMTLLAFIASVSWLVLGKGHAAAHLHLAPVVWMILFVPLALMSCGWMCEICRRRFVRLPLLVVEYLRRKDPAKTIPAGTVRESETSRLAGYSPRRGSHS